WATAVYAGVASFAAVICLVQRLPARFAGAETGWPIALDFLFGAGVAMAPSAWYLVLLLAVRRWASRTGRTGRIALAALALMLAFGNSVGMIGEPFLWRTLDERNVARLAILAAMVVIPAVGALVAWRAFRAAQPPVHGRRRILRLAGDGLFALAWLV